ncbi:MAG: hypothetical protein JJ895_14590 [Balneolaceae bacterium]|nr:hypothetical protein [Balneolaceae bacterium]
MEQDAKLIGEKAFSLIQKLKSGAISENDYRSDPVAVAKAHGIVIHHSKVDEFRSKVKDSFQKRDHAEIRTMLVATNQGCFWCEQGMTVAIAALAILSIAAIAYAVVTFTGGFGVEAIIAFLESQFAVNVSTAIIVVGAGVLAEMLCKEFGACN